MPSRPSSGHALQLATCCLALVGTLVATRAGDDPVIRFTSPRNLATVLGRSTIELQLDLPPGARVLRLELEVDGRRLATLTDAPWRAAWDAGDGERGHRLEARLVLSDGRTASAALQTSALQIDQIERVDLVDLYVIVLDRGGNYIADLQRDDFRILENGEPQTIERFSTDRKPLRVGITLDTSSTMRKEGGERIRGAKEAALEFLEVLEPDDQAMLVTFNDSVEVIQGLTDDHAPLARAIESVEARGGTALYDAVWRTAKELRGHDGRRVIVLLSDGRDESYSGLEPGSLHTLDEALDQALRSEVMIFSIGLGRNLDREYAVRFGALYGESNQDVKQSQEGILRRLADSTGGRALISPSSGRLQRSFQGVASDLRNQYSVAYLSTDRKMDGRWREVRVSIPGRADAQVVTRRGFYAAKRSADTGTPAGPQRDSRSSPD